MKGHPLSWWGCCAMLALLVLHTQSAVIAATVAFVVSLLVLFFRDTSYWYHSYAFTLKIALSLFILDRKSTRLNSSHSQQSRMPSSA